jgi:hypothetical protein
MDRKIGIIPIMAAFTSISISRQAHTLFKADKMAYQAIVGKQLSDSDFLVVVLNEYRKMVQVIGVGKYAGKRK